MAYTNSPLVNVTLLSPNHSGQRIHAIDTITIHCVVGQCTAKRIGEIFQPTSRQASSNYGVGLDGSIGLYVEEKNRSWCSSSNANDQRAITIEVASDTKEPTSFWVPQAARDRTVASARSRVSILLIRFMFSCSFFVFCGGMILL